LRLIFIGAVHRSQGMTLQRAVVNCCMKFWEHGQLYVTLSGVKSPGNLCILLPDDMDDFTIRPAVNVDVIQILETMQFSRPRLIPQISPGDNVESSIASIWRNYIKRIILPRRRLRRSRGSNSLGSQSRSWCCWNSWLAPGWDTSQCSYHITDLWEPTGDSI
jgi:hypothetical protein